VRPAGEVSGVHVAAGGAARGGHGAPLLAALHASPPDDARVVQAQAAAPLAKRLTWARASVVMEPTTTSGGRDGAPLNALREGIPADVAEAVLESVLPRMAGDVLPKRQSGPKCSQLRQGDRLVHWRMWNPMNRALSGSFRHAQCFDQFGTLFGSPLGSQKRIETDPKKTLQLFRFPAIPHLHGLAKPPRARPSASTPRHGSHHALTVPAPGACSYFALRLCRLDSLVGLFAIGLRAHRIRHDPFGLRRACGTHW